MNNLELTTMQLDPKYSVNIQLLLQRRQQNDIVFESAMTGQHMGSVAKMQNVITHMVND
jgi:hypothetical protein